VVELGTPTRHVVFGVIAALDAAAAAGDADDGDDRPRRLPNGQTAGFQHTARYVTMGTESVPRGLLRRGMHRMASVEY